MQLTINTETKSISIQQGETVLLKDLFNFIHDIDADNADKWEIVSPLYISTPTVEYEPYKVKYDDMSTTGIGSTIRSDHLF